MFIASIVGLAAAFTVAAVAIFGSHIPIIRDLTGAAPHQPEDQPVDTTPVWAARLEAADKEDQS